ncbi:metal-dependent hydrolase, partial [Halorubrum sp. SS5]
VTAANPLANYALLGLGVAVAAAALVAGEAVPA